MQVFKSLCSLPDLGMQGIAPSRKLLGRIPFSKDSLKTLRIQLLNSMKVFKNSLVKPSGWGALLSLLFFKDSSTSRILKGLSRVSLLD